MPEDIKPGPPGEGTSPENQRRFIRHPASIPIDVEMEAVALREREYLINISSGGLCFHSNCYLMPGCMIRISIPLMHPVFVARGKVVWCSRENGGFEAGVVFLKEIEVFRTRMVEQICHIETYKREVLAKEGRTLTGEEAAIEWIRDHAADFPRPEASGDGPS